MAGATAEEQSEPRRQVRKLYRHLWRTRRRELLIACLAALISVALLLIVILLMSFIEFQTRLAKAQPTTPSSDLVNLLVASYVADDAYERYRLNWEEYGLRAQEAGRLKVDSSDRIDRICSMFCPSPRDRLQTLWPTSPDARKPPSKQPDTAQEPPTTVGFSAVEACLFFMAKIPFEGTATAPTSQVGPRGNYTRNRSDYAAALSDDAKLGDAILENFVALLEIPQERVSPYKQVLRKQLLKIAEVNRRLAVELQPELVRLKHEADAQCTRFVSARRQMDPGNNDGFACISAKPEQPAKTVRGRSLCSPTLAADEEPSTDAPDRTRAGQGRAGDPTTEQPFAGQLGETRSSPATAQLAWELVTHFRLYHDLTRGLARNLILSPPDYLAQWLLLFGGALGAMLNILFKHLAVDKTNAWSDLLVGPAQGMACAVIVFILFRSGFVVIAGQNESVDTATLNSYFVAFIAIGSGMLADQALTSFRNASAALFGRIEARGPDRWAIGLRDALAKPPVAPNTPEALATRLDVKPEIVNRWVRLLERVPPEKQKAIVVALGVDEATLFTDVTPRSTPTAGTDAQVGGTGT